MDADATAATWKAAATWKGLADSYEAARTRPDSFDVLMEFPAQLDLIGDVAGKRVLDLACGSGAKAIHLARQGAREVVGVDISETFVSDVAHLDPPSTTRFLRGDISRLDEIQGLCGRFDVVLLLNALGYADDELATLRAIRSLIEDAGAFRGRRRLHPRARASAAVRGRALGLDRCRARSRISRPQPLLLHLQLGREDDAQPSHRDVRRHRQPARRSRLLDRARRRADAERGAAPRVPSQGGVAGSLWRNADCPGAAAPVDRAMTIVALARAR